MRTMEEFELFLALVEDRDHWLGANDTDVEDSWAPHPLGSGGTEYERRG
jgi:hypothetical protein